MGIDVLLGANPKILVVGGGGREHAIIWRLRKDRPDADLYCAPGNAGTADIARSINIGAGDVANLVAWARSDRPDVVVVGPEEPLIAGLVDELAGVDIAAFGPRRSAAEIEGSKAFSSALLARIGAPAPAHRTFDDAGAAFAYAQEANHSIVVKADGPALGKGVTVCDTPKEAQDAISRSMVDGAFGAAGRRVVMQERLRGPELSVLVVSDGRNFRTLGVARDYKRAGDGDTGPNTGGMGSYTPVKEASTDLVSRVEQEIIGPVLNALREDERPYVGVLYAGLVLTEDGPKAIEFNCRMGDPETQVLLPVLTCDFADLIHATLSGALDQKVVSSCHQAAVAVVLTSEGYPGPTVTGHPIQGLDSAEPSLVFHGGTKRHDGNIRTAGGRVLATVGIADELSTARDQAYARASSIQFHGVTYRTDIAAETAAPVTAS